jgi:hypothetical protein
MKINVVSYFVVAICWELRAYIPVSSFKYSIILKLEYSILTVQKYHNGLFEYSILTVQKGGHTKKDIQARNCQQLAATKDSRNSNSSHSIVSNKRQPPATTAAVAVVSAKKGKDLAKL